MDVRSPLQGIFNIVGGLSQSRDKPVKYALYNAVAFLLVCLCCAAGWALVVILGPFVKPLMWALLVGSVLHPLKKSLRDSFRNWFDTLEHNHTPMIVGMVLLPLKIMVNTSELIGDLLWKYIRTILGVSVAALVLPVLYFYTPQIVTKIIWNSYWLLTVTVNFALSVTTVPIAGLAVLLYITVVYLLWKPENNITFHYSSVGVWVILCLLLSNQFGALGLPVFLVTQLLLVAGIILEVQNIQEKKQEEGDKSAEESGVESQDGNEETEETKDLPEVPPKQEKRKNSVKFSDETANVTKKDPLALELFESVPKHQSVTRTQSELGDASYFITKQGIHVIHSKKKDKFGKLRRTLSQPQFTQNTDSNFLRFGINLYRTQYTSSEETHGSTFYLYTLLWASGAMLLWKNVMLLPLLSLPILFYSLKHLGLYLGLWQYAYSKFMEIWESIKGWCNERYDALVPLPARGLFRIIFVLNMHVQTFFKNSADTISSCLVISGLIVFLICASVFFVIQIYSEAIMLVQIGSNVINRTVVHNPELRQLLPPSFDDTLDSILDNAYLYGRQGISKAVKSLMSDVDSNKTEKIEKQILELWDRVYQSWMTTNVPIGPTVTPEAVASSWDDFVADIKKSPEMFNFVGVIEFGKQNVGTLISLMDSIWSIVKGNVTLILRSVGAFLSVILGGGSAVMNFILNVVVFLTTLFYLLNSSGELYKPVEMMTNFSPSGSRFGRALEGAVNGVFAASFKMAAFYGLWTWFIHNLFSVRIVYLPSAFAMILGAVPFLGTYWAGVPAVLDLWLAQDRGLAAIFFAGFQFLPTSIVDTTIYKEIKGGHPYLTALAIAGGVFCLGVEGAIIGPILLCGLYVAMDLSSNMFKESMDIDDGQGD